jgi:arylsulfatase A-like enzyme
MNQDPLPAVVGDRFSKALFGKWGLVGETPDPTRHAVAAGYDFFRGHPDSTLKPEQYDDWTKHTAHFDSASPNPSCDANQIPPSWHRDPICVAALTEDGATRCAPAAAPCDAIYATMENVDDALLWINAVPSGQPWLVTLSFNAAHAPNHAPPGTGLPCPGSPDLTCYRAMVTAMDEQIQDLLDGLPAGDTTIIFLGDNGSEKGVAVDPFDPDRAKFTLYEGGINIPLIVSGAAVKRTGAVVERESQALVNTTDLFITLLELSGATLDMPEDWEHDSFSLVPILDDDCAGGCTEEGVRQYAYAERIEIGKAIRNRDGYKLIYGAKDDVHAWELFSLADDPFEDVSLLDSASGNLLVADTDLQVILDDLRQKLGEPGAPPNLPSAGLDPDGDGVTILDRPCEDDSDNDGDGMVDCGDTACQGVGICGEIECTDLWDNDGDGAVDCADSDCTSSPCGPEGEFNCGDGFDNDGDGEIDCRWDPDCQLWGCGEFECSDSIDNDGDGLTDCGPSADPDCTDLNRDGDLPKYCDDNCPNEYNPLQFDTDLDGCGNVCDTDWDQSGLSAFSDFGLWAMAFGSSNQNFKILEPHTGPVGFSDFGQWSADFGNPPGPSGTTNGTMACP